MQKADALIIVAIIISFPHTLFLFLFSQSRSIVDTAALDPAGTGGNFYGHPLVSVQELVK